MTIIAAILVFCVIIIVHECGHFFAAKACGIKVDEFAIGMGPAIIKIQGKETRYCIKLLPIGGSVSMGEDESSDDPRSFRNKPVWQRMITIVAGAVMNLILGLIVCLISVLSSDYIVTTTIKGFYDGAATANVLQSDDEIVSINGTSVWTSMDIAYSLQNSAAKETEDYVTFDFTVRRDNQLIDINDVTFATRDTDSGKSIVLDFYVYTAEKDFSSVLSAGVKTFATEARLIWISLIDLLTGTYGINDLSGPIGVVSSVSQAATSMSIGDILSLVAFITINVGIFNLLPIPALDGARFLFLLIEAIRRKPMKPEHEGIVHFVGFAALMLLMLVVTFNDIMRLFQ